MSKLREFLLVTALVLEFKKVENVDKAKYTTFYSNLKAKKIIIESDINDISDI